MKLRLLESYNNYKYDQLAAPVGHIFLKNCYKFQLSKIFAVNPKLVNYK